MTLTKVQKANLQLVIDANNLDLDVETISLAMASQIMYRAQKGDLIMPESMVAYEAPVGVIKSKRASRRRWEVIFGSIVLLLVFVAYYSQK